MSCTACFPASSGSIESFLFTCGLVWNKLNLLGIEGTEKLDLVCRFLNLDPDLVESSDY